MRSEPRTPPLEVTSLRVIVPHNRIELVIESCPNPYALISDEKAALIAYTNVSMAEEAFYKQKARVYWIKLGDQNTSYFHKQVAVHRARNKVVSINNSQGTRHDKYAEVKDIVSYFQGMLGSPNPYPVNGLSRGKELVQPTLPDHQLSCWTLLLLILKQKFSLSISNDSPWA